MARSQRTHVDELPSLLWLIIPPLLIASAWYVRKWYLARRLRVHGIGKGAPGFQTNVARIRVTPEIAARLRRGEDVSPEEIQKAADEMRMREAEGLDNPKGHEGAGHHDTVSDEKDTGAESGNDVKGKSKGSHRTRRKTRKK